MDFDLSNTRSALLIIDLQELFTSADGPFENTTAAELIVAVNSFALDCHHMGLPIIFSRYLFRDDLSDAGLLADNPVVLTKQDGAKMATLALCRSAHTLARLFI